MKSYTNLEQSKKLAEILPIESADMYYFTIIRDYPYSQGKIKTIAKIMDDSFSSNYDTPCWSLSALLDVMKEPELIRNSENTWLIRVWYNAYPYSNGGYNNPVDACVEMIVKLKEKDLL